LQTLLASWADSTLKQYQVALKSWWFFNDCSPVKAADCSVEKCLVFLQNQVDRGVSYGTVCSYRAALGVLNPGLSNSPVLERFVKGVFRATPRRPRYTATWDPKLVLHHLGTYPRQFVPWSKKLCMLLALTSAQRVQTLAAITVNDLRFSSAGVTIMISSNLKTSAPTRRQLNIVLKRFEQEEVCPVKTLEVFLDLSRPIRGDSSQLFLCTKKPFRPASTQTLGRWLKEVLAKSGIDVTLFTGHSTRHAATSAALRNGATLGVIFKAAGWTEESTVFARHYCLPLLSSETPLSSYVLN